MRRLRFILVSSVVALALVNTHVYLVSGSATPANLAAEAGDRGQWSQLPEARRLALVHRYEAISRQEDGAEILGWAHEFARAPAAEQDRCRDLWEVTMRIIARQPPDQRRDLLRSSARARAFLLYQMLESQEPDTFERLRRELSAPLEPAPP